MKHTKKLLSLLLVLCLVLSLSCTVRSICTRPWHP